MQNTTPPTTESRKVDHIRINLEENVQFPNVTTGLERYRFVHNAIPEINLDDVDTSTTVLQKTLSAPFLISSMTGGAQMAKKLNTNLAIAAQEKQIAMGLGSQRAAIEDETLAATFNVRDVAPDVLLFANVGAVQLNYGYGVEECQRAVDMAQADALILHFNVLQEAVQPEGDVNWAGLLRRVEQVTAALPVPVIAKEVGWGFSVKSVQQLTEAGIQIIDVAGAGGTSWSEVEYHRAPTSFHANVAKVFADWGIPTAEAIQNVKRTAPQHTIIASGGLRSGVDVAKCMAMGASLGGLAGPFLKAADHSVEAVLQLIDELTAQLRIAMFCTGSSMIPELQDTELIQLP
ncbi:MAG: type 2 isopentenyl-diphosphate Delta-isomerase [Chloroflexota bacterium]